MRDIEKYTTIYTKDDFESEHQVVYRRKKILEIMARYPHRRILEIGCGLDPIAKYLHDFDTCTIVEPSEQFASRARRQLGASIEIIQDFFENSIAKLHDREFDFILISSLLHELEDPDIFLQGIARIAGPDTVIHANVPNAKSFHRLLALESGLIQSTHELSQQNKDWQQHRVFDMDSFIEFLQNSMNYTDSNIHILEKGGYFIKPFTHRQMASCLKHGILDEQVLDGLYNMVKYIPELASEIFVNFCIR